MNSPESRRSFGEGLLLISRLIFIFRHDVAFMIIIASQSSFICTDSSYDIACNTLCRSQHDIAYDSAMHIPLASCSRSPDRPMCDVRHCDVPGGTGINNPIDCPNASAPVKPNFNISDLCPQFADAACCDEVQYVFLQTSVQKYASILGFCPACVYNLNNFFCEFSCSPRQGLFVQVTKNISNLNHSALVVDAVDLYMDAQLAQDIFTSCDGVQFAGQPALGFFNESYSYEQLFTFFGTQGTDPSTSSPLQINFAFTLPLEANESLSSLTATAPFIGCSDIGEYQCPCDQCPSTCGVSCASANGTGDGTVTGTFAQIGYSRVEPITFILFIILIIYLGIMLITLQYRAWRLTLRDNAIIRSGIFASICIIVILVEICICAIIWTIITTSTVNIK